MEELIDEIRQKIKTYRMIAEIVLQLDWDKHEQPELCPEPTGDVGLQWRKEDKIFVISMSENLELTWAYLDKVKNIHGTIKYDRILPKELKCYLDLFTKEKQNEQ